MNLLEREGLLLKLVDDHCEDECRRLLADAQHEARELIGETYRRGRQRLRERVRTERERLQERIRAAEAELATGRRMGQERLSLRLIETAWPKLRVLLSERWQAGRSRIAWLEKYLTEAGRSLPTGRWRIRCAPGPSPDELREACERLLPEFTEPPEISIDPSLEAGLVIASGEAFLDASLSGLLGDRRSLEARLLAILVRLEEK